MRNHTYQIKAVWDVEARVWVTTSDDVPKLVNEASTMDALLKKLEILTPELLEAHDTLPATTEIPDDKRSVAGLQCVAITYLHLPALPIGKASRAARARSA